MLIALTILTPPIPGIVLEMPGAELGSLWLGRSAGCS